MKTIKITLTLLVTGLILFVSSCQTCVEGEGNVRKERRGLKPFEALNVNIAAEVFVQLADTNMAIVEAPANILKQIETGVRSKTLHIDAGCYKTEKSIRITIKARSLNDIELSGSGKIKVMNALSADKINLELSGSGQIETDVLTPRVDADLDGSGVIIINGTAEEFNGDVTGSGIIRALGLRAKEVYLDLSGSGEVYTAASKLLKCSVSGSGVIHYTGNPKVRSKIDGTGRVEKIN